MADARCLVPDCARVATSGQWREAITAYRMGISLSIQVEDLAVSLSICETHAKELTAVGLGFRRGSAAKPVGLEPAFEIAERTPQRVSQSPGSRRRAARLLNRTVLTRPDRPVSGRRVRSRTGHGEIPQLVRHASQLFSRIQR